MLLKQRKLTFVSVAVAVGAVVVSAVVAATVVVVAVAFVAVVVVTKRSELEAYTLNAQQ